MSTTIRNGRPNQAHSLDGAERGVYVSGITAAPPVMRVVGQIDRMRILLNIAKFAVAAALFGFGVVIIVGFIGVLLEGPLEDPLWQHLLCVTFMGVLPMFGAALLFFLKFPQASAQQAAPPNGGPAVPVASSGVVEGPPSVS